MTTAPLFLVDALPAGDTAVLDGPEGRHAATVKRLRAGEGLVLADGRGGLAHAVVTAVGKDALRLEVVDRRTLAAPAPRVLLAQALVKGDRGELAVELATEAGVDGVLPWRAARCVARWEAGPRGEKALARWRTTAREAAKQARRAVGAGGRGAGDDGGAGAAGRGRARSRWCCTSRRRTGWRRSTCPPTAISCSSSAPRAGSPTTSWTRSSWRGRASVRLGPEVLRASTAAAVALGALGVLTGRWTRLP